METIHELIPFAREMLSQKPNRKMVKMYVVGSVLAFFGVVIGLVETVCSPFASWESTEEEEEKKTSGPEREQEGKPARQEEPIRVKSEFPATGARSLATRGHAS